MKKFREDIHSRRRESLLCKARGHDGIVNIFFRYDMQDIGGTCSLLKRKSPGGDEPSGLWINGVSLSGLICRIRREP